MEEVGHGFVVLGEEVFAHGGTFGCGGEAGFDVDEAFVAFAVVVVEVEARGGEGGAVLVAEVGGVVDAMAFDEQHGAFGDAHAVE